MAIFVATVLFFILSVPSSVISSQTTIDLTDEYINDCVNCVQQEKFYYRGLFPSDNGTTACVWSSTHLEPNSFIFKKACNVQDCDKILSIDSNLLTNLECFNPHPLS